MKKKVVNTWLCDNCNRLEHAHRIKCTNCGYARHKYRHATDPHKLNKAGLERAR